jgi:hypothetical protein
MEDYYCPWCQQGFDNEGYCACGDSREVHQAWLDEGREWAKDYLPEGWHEYPWQILEHMNGLAVRRGQNLEIHSMAVVGHHPTGWYGVIVCETFDPIQWEKTVLPEYKIFNELNYEIFNFYPPDEQPQVGPFATKEEATQAILHRLTQLEEQLEPVPLPTEAVTQAVKDRFAQREDHL